jgi:hypothetical protein
MLLLDLDDDEAFRLGDDVPAARAAWLVSR